MSKKLNKILTMNLIKLGLIFIVPMFFIAVNQAKADTILVATNVNINGNPAPGSTLTGSYDIAAPWLTIGDGAMSLGQARHNNIVFNATGTPYAVYKDESNNQITTKMFDGTAWQTVGTPFTAVDTISISLAIDSTGTPYVAYNGPSPFKAMVKNLPMVLGNQLVIQMVFHQLGLTIFLWP